MTTAPLGTSKGANMRWKRTVAVGLAALFTARAAMAGHLVGESDIDAALEEARGRRASDAATVDAFLTRPLTVETGRRMGVDLDWLRAQAGRLSDGELRDIAARAELLETDPVAGGAGRVILIVFLLGALLLVVLLAGVVLCAADDDCYLY